MSKEAVNKAAWPWREPPAAAARHAPNRVRAVIMAILLTGATWFVYYKSQAHPRAQYLAIVPALAALATLVGAFIYPPLDRAMTRFAGIITLKVGTALTWGLLTPFFYLCFAPGHLILRLKGTDPMQRAFRTGQASYWEPRPPVRDPAQYQKQF